MRSRKLFFRRKVGSILAGSVVTLLFPKSATATTFIYSNTTSNTAGTATAWSAGTNWSATPVSSATTILTLGNGAGLSAGTTIFTNNDIASPSFQLNALNFTYAGPSSGSSPQVTVSGNPLEFVSNGPTAPTLAVNPTGAFKPMLTINDALLLTNNLTATVNSSTTMTGAVSGGGSLTKAGSDLLTLTGLSNFSGGLTVSGGTLNFFHDANLGVSTNGVTLAGGTLQSSSAYSSHSLTVSNASIIDTAGNFFTFPTTLWTGPLSGSGALTKTGGGIFFFASGASNAFTGDITVAPNGGTFQIGSSPAGGLAGATFPGLTSANTITVGAGGTFQIQENDATQLVNGYTANRFGSTGNRPNVNMTGGILKWNAADNTATMSQTFGNLNLVSGASTISVTRNLAGTPELTFGSLNRSSGAVVSFSPTSVGSAATDVAQIYFASAPTLVGGGGAAGTTTLSILPGARAGNDVVTYDVNGVRPLTASEYNNVAGNDINPAGATDNVKMSAATPTAYVALSAPKTINSLVVSAPSTSTWAMGDTLTVTSGEFFSIGNSLNVTSGALTAGTGTGGTAELNLANASPLTIGANINNNASTSIALVKSNNGQVTLSNTTDNGYSNGTFVDEGTLVTGSTAGVRYLGSGPVVVASAGQLNLGATGATSFNGSTAAPTYTVKTTGQISLPNAAPGANEFFMVEAGGVISNSGTTGAAGLDLNTNLNAAPEAILSESVAGANVAIKKGGVSIQTALTTPTYFFGITGAGFNLQENITVGAGTPWLGLSVSRAAANYGGVSSTNNTITANSDFILQGLGFPGFGGLGLAPIGLGAGSSSTNIVKIATPNGNVNVLVGNYVELRNDHSQYGSNGNTVTFVVQGGAELQCVAANAQGVVGGTAIAPAAIVVRNGGLATDQNGDPAAFNGNVLIQPGGMFTPYLSTLTGTGTITHSNGSILLLSSTGSTAAISGATQALGTVPGTIVRLGTPGLLPGNTTAGVTDFDNRLNDAAIYELTNNITMGNASAATDSLFSLSASAGLGGMLTNDAVTRTLGAATGMVKIGAGGGTFAATTGTTVIMLQTFALGANTLNIGSAQSFDGNPKLGTVQLSASGNTNTGSAGSVISVLNGATLSLAGADQIPDATRLNVNAGGTVDLSNNSDTVESLTGAGTITNTGLSAATLTLSATTNDANFTGSLTAPTPSNLAVTKTGAGTQILSGTNSYAGTTNISGGVLKVNGSIGSAVVVGPGTLAGNGTVAGTVTINSGGAIAPGDGIGTLAAGSLSLTSANASFKLEIDLGQVLNADLLNVTGSVSLGGATLDVSLFNANTNGLPETFVIVANDSTDPVTGTFSAITGVPNGYNVTVNYNYSGTDALGRVGDGNDIAVTVATPEPTTLTLSIAGVPFLGMRRRRRERKLAKGQPET